MGKKMGRAESLLIHSQVRDELWQRVRASLLHHLAECKQYREGIRHGSKT